MGVYVPPSVRTVREDIQASVVISGGQVVPAFFGKSLGKKVAVGAYEAFMGTSTTYTFPALGSAGPIDVITGVRSQPSGGIIYSEGVDFTFDEGLQQISWLAVALAAPYITTITEETGTSTLVAATTYYYVVTALKTLDQTGPVTGETVASNENSIKISASSKRAKLTWTPVPGAESYRVYRSTVSGNYTGSALLATVSGGFNNTYTDSGTATIAGSPPGVAVYAQVTAANAPTYDLEPAQTVTVSVNGGAGQVSTFTGTRGSRSGTGATYPLTITLGVDDTLGVKVDGGATQNIVIPAAVYNTAGDLAAALNPLMVGGYFDVDAGQLRINSDTRGSNSSIQVTGGTSLTAIGHTVGTTSGTGNVANIDAVTAAEVASVINAATTGFTASVTAAGVPTLIHDTAGLTNTLQVSAGSANATIGFPTTLFTGNNATAGTALRRPAVKTGGGNGEAFYVDYIYVNFTHFTAKKFTNLGLLISEYGLGSDLAIAATLAMGSAGRGNNASVLVAMSVPDINLVTLQAALTFLEKRKDIDLVVPIATTAGINSAVKSHCEFMSNVDNKRERIGVLGVPLGTKLGDEDTVDTAIYLARQLDTNRMVLTYPWPVVDIQNSAGEIVETEMDGWASAAAVAGRIAALPDRAEPPTMKQVFGIKKLAVELDEQEENMAGGAGLCVLTEENGNIMIRDAITTSLASQTDQEININLTDDFLRKTLRSQFRAFRGRKLLPGLLDQIQKRTAKVLAQFVKFGLIVGYDSESITATQDPDVLTQILVRFSYRPVFPARIIEFRYSFDLRTSALAA